MNKNYVQTLQRIEGVLPFLDYCQQHNITMACVTNKPEHLAQGILDILQLSPYFQDGGWW